MTRTSLDLRGEYVTGVDINVPTSYAVGDLWTFNLESSVLFLQNKISKMTTIMIFLSEFHQVMPLE